MSKHFKSVTKHLYSCLVFLLRNPLYPFLVFILVLHLAMFKMYMGAHPGHIVMPINLKSLETRVEVAKYLFRQFRGLKGFSIHQSDQLSSGGEESLVGLFDADQTFHICGSLRHNYKATQNSPNSMAPFRCTERIRGFSVEGVRIEKTSSLLVITYNLIFLSSGGEASGLILPVKGIPKQRFSTTFEDILDRVPSGEIYDGRFYKNYTLNTYEDTVVNFLELVNDGDIFSDKVTLTINNLPQLLPLLKNKFDVSENQASKIYAMMSNYASLKHYISGSTTNREHAISLILFVASSGIVGSQPMFITSEWKVVLYTHYILTGVLYLIFGGIILSDFNRLRLKLISRIR